MSNTHINDMPDEMLIGVLEKLTLHELVVNTSKTCWIWSDLIARFVFGPKVLELADGNAEFKADILADKWTRDCQDPFCRCGS